MGMENTLILDIPISTGATTAALFPGYRFMQELQAGYIWYMESAYIAADTTVAAATSDANLWYLRDEDGNTIASFASGGALSTAGTTLASISSTYREIDATSARHTFYAVATQSGNGVTPPRNLVIHTRWTRRRPGSAA